MDRIGPNLEEFYRVANALKDRQDTGNCLVDGLISSLGKDTDGQDFERALLYLEMTDLTPMIIMWRRRYIEKVLEYLDDPPDPLELKVIDVWPRTIKEPLDEDS